MSKIFRVGLTLVAMLALATAFAAAASAEVPTALVLPGEKISNLKLEATGGASALEGETTLKTITATKTIAKLSGCKALSGKEADATECEALLEFKGAKQGAVNCRSESGLGKDPIETILTKVSVTLGSETEKEGGKLVPTLISSVLGSDGASPLKILCGVVKETVEGKVACLVTPGLTEVATNETLTLTCTQKDGKQVTGTCVEPAALCPNLGLKASLDGTTKENAAEEIKLTGSPSEMLTLDD